MEQEQKASDGILGIIKEKMQEHGSSMTPEQSAAWQERLKEMDAPGYWNGVQETASTNAADNLRLTVDHVMKLAVDNGIYVGFGWHPTNSPCIVVRNAGGSEMMFSMGYPMAEAVGIFLAENPAK